MSDIASIRKRLLRNGSFTRSSFPAPRFCATSTEVAALPLAELVDFEKELARIAKEKANAEKQLAGIENKLKNEGFLAKAPEAVVNGARADAEKLKALIEKLDASAAAMKK